jgi:hypothetical protein
VHAACVLLQVMDAACPAPTSVADDSGEELHASASAVKLPPTDSVDRLLLSQSSRLVYSLTGILGAAALSGLEQAFITRPTGGAALDWRYGYRTLTDFPPAAMQELGHDAVASAAALLRTLWERLPLLRTVIAHVATVSLLNVANCVGDIRVWVYRRGLLGGSRPSSTATALQGPGKAGGEAGAGDADGFAVNIPEEVVQARLAGVLLARLEAEPGQYGVAGAASGKPRSFSSSIAGGLSSSAGGGAQGDSARRRVHPLVVAVEGRLRASTIKRVDGIVMGTLDVEEFDETLC